MLKTSIAQVCFVLGVVIVLSFEGNRSLEAIEKKVVHKDAKTTFNRRLRTSRDSGSSASKL